MVAIQPATHLGRHTCEGAGRLNGWPGNEGPRRGLRDEGWGRGIGRLRR